MTDDADHRSLYEGVIRAIRYNTGGPQPPGMRVEHLLSNRHRAGVARETVEQKLGIATGRTPSSGDRGGDLITWADADGHDRVAEPTVASARALVAARCGEVTPGAVVAVIEAEVERDEPRMAFIGRLNDLHDELRERDDQDGERAVDTEGVA